MELSLIMLFLAIILYIIFIIMPKKRKNNYHNNYNYRNNYESYEKVDDGPKYNDTNIEKPEEEYDYKHNIIEDKPYQKKCLLTNAEYNFFVILKRKCENVGLIVCPKVRMEDFLNVVYYQNSYRYRGYIKSRHIDFVICDRKMNVIAAVELDDSTHYDKKAKENDKFKDDVFESINTPLFRLKPYKQYYESEIDNIIKQLRY